MKYFHQIFLLGLVLTVSTLCSAKPITGMPMNEKPRKIKKWARANSYSYVKVKGENLSNQISTPNTIYEITRPYDLNDVELSLPDNVYFIFSKKGLINGGSINGHLKNDFIDVKCFGAVADGKTDCRSAIQTAILLSNGVVDFGMGEYYISGSFYITKDNVTLSGTGATLHFRPQGNHIDAGLYLRDCKNISIKGLNFTSDNTQHNATTFNRKKEDGWSNMIGISASKVSNLLIENCTFSNLEYAIKIDGQTGLNDSVRLADIETKNSVANPLYISYASNVRIDGCLFDASTDGSSYDHHIYASTACSNHSIRNCTFIGGEGIPVHYFTYDKQGAHNISVTDCRFVDTHGACIISSPDNGNMFVRNCKMNSDVAYENGAFRNEGNNTLEVSNCTITACSQYLFAISGSNSTIDSIVADVKGLQMTLPYGDKQLMLSNSNITIHDSPYLVYLNATNGANLGKISFCNNVITTLCDMQYLFSIRGTSKNSFVVNSNVILCKKPVSYVFYNAGAVNPKIEMAHNQFSGCKELKHVTVRDGVFSENILK